MEAQIFYMVISVLLGCVSALIAVVGKLVYDMLKEIRKVLTEKVDEDICRERRNALLRDIDDLYKGREL